MENVVVTPYMEELLRLINALPIEERQELVDEIDDSIEQEDDAEMAALLKAEAAASGALD